jgi:hypothetical protein
MHLVEHGCNKKEILRKRKVFTLFPPDALQCPNGANWNHFRIPTLKCIFQKKFDSVVFLDLKTI